GVSGPPPARFTLCAAAMAGSEERTATGEFDGAASADGFTASRVAGFDGAGGLGAAAAWVAMNATVTNEVSAVAMDGFMGDFFLFDDAKWLNKGNARAALR